MSGDEPLGVPIGVRTASGGFETSNGTIYVSKPFRSKASKKLRAMIKFTPRTSHFDTSNESSGANEFRGFFTLFWISMFLFTLRTYTRSLETHGYVLSLAFATMFSKDAITLVVSDAVLVASTAICVPFAKAISKGWMPYYWTGLILQHFLQSLILFAAVTWTFNRQWPWVQSGFLTLHSLVMIMKMHSYMTTNGQLKIVADQSQVLLRKLKAATIAAGGWDKAILAAKARRMQSDELSGMSNSDVSTPDASVEGTNISFVDAPTAAALRRRLVAVSLNNSSDNNIPTSSEAGFAIHPLVDHPDVAISTLATELSESQGELSSSGPNPVQWPDNITFKNFAVYQLIPTLVYELEYPRTDRIRPVYVFEKTVATFGTFALLYTVTESFILPSTPTPDQSFFRSLLDLALPFMIAYLLIFYIIFECICNGFAELSYFSDRQFYEDWVELYFYGGCAFNVDCTRDMLIHGTEPEFSRKWNKPVHTFLLRHVYASTISNYQISRTTAMFITFLFSAAVHELVMIVVTQKIRMYLFLLQLIQLPLIAMSRLPVIKNNKLLGNVVFWLGLYAGLPLLCVAYVAY